MGLMKKAAQFAEKLNFGVELRNFAKTAWEEIKDKIELTMPVNLEEFSPECLAQINSLVDHLQADWEKCDEDSRLIIETTISFANSLIKKVNKVAIDANYINEEDLAGLNKTFKADLESSGAGNIGQQHVFESWIKLLHKGNRSALMALSSHELFSPLNSRNTIQCFTKSRASDAGYILCIIAGNHKPQEKLFDYQLFLKAFSISLVAIHISLLTNAEALEVAKMLTTLDLPPSLFEDLPAHYHRLNELKMELKSDKATGAQVHLTRVGINICNDIQKELVKHLQIYSPPSNEPPKTPDSGIGSAASSPDRLSKSTFLYPCAPEAPTPPPIKKETSSPTNSSMIYSKGAPSFSSNSLKVSGPTNHVEHYTLKAHSLGSTNSCPEGKVNISAPILINLGRKSAEISTPLPSTEPSETQVSCEKNNHLLSQDERQPEIAEAIVDIKHPDTITLVDPERKKPETLLTAEPESCKDINHLSAQYIKSLEALKTLKNSKNFLAKHKKPLLIFTIVALALFAPATAFLFLSMLELGGIAAIVAGAALVLCAVFYWSAKQPISLISESTISSPCLNSQKNQVGGS